MSDQAGTAGRQSSGGGSRRRRSRWEGRYQKKQGTEFCWYLDEPPPELISLVQGDGFPVLPFRSGRFALVFDRGCLQAIPKEAWPTYFREVERLLEPGGVLQLFCSKPMKRFPSLLSYRGVRARARWMLGRRGPQFLSHDLLHRLAEPGLAVQELRDFPFQPKVGPLRAMTYGVFTKRAGGPSPS